MKKIILILAVLSISLLNAQKRKSTPIYSSDGMGFNKGAFVASGLFGFVSKGTAAGKESTFGFQPSGGYFVTDNFTIGASLGFKTTSTTATDGTSASASEFGLGIFGRYYFKPETQFSLFLQGGFEFASSSQSVGGGNTTRFGFGFKPGISYFLNNHFVIDATVGQLGFTNTSFSGGGTSDTDFTFGFDFTQIGFGLGYKF